MTDQRPASKSSNAWPKRPDTIVFFDGVCGLCNRFVDFVLRSDPAGSIVFAPLQGETAAQLLGLDAASRASPSSIIVLTQEQRLERTAAVAAILAQLPGAWPLLGRCLSKTAPAIANRAYNFVAARRYALFGRKDTCRMPTPEERARFLP